MRNKDLMLKMIHSCNVGGALKRLRHYHKITQKEFAENVGFKYSTVVKIERGIQVIKPEELQNILDYYVLDLNFLQFSDILKDLKYPKWNYMDTFKYQENIWKVIDINNSGGYVITRLINDNVKSMIKCFSFEELQGILE